MGSREILCYLALATALTLTGCQTPGGSENAGDQGNWWNWGTKTPQPTSTSGSPFSAAATYNRNNNPTEMGLTLYDSTSHAKPAEPPANLPPAVPCANAAPQATPGTAYPPGAMNPGAVPAAGPPPGMVNPAPTGYWVYQPANGYPVTGQNGMPVCIPVYGPPMNTYPGYPPPTMNGNPTPPANMVAGPVQAGAYPTNYPPNCYPPNYPATAPVSMPVNLPPTNSAGPAQAAPNFAAPSPTANSPR